MIYRGICEKCGAPFEKVYTDEYFARIRKRNELPRFCSKSCANSHIVSNETRLKISKALKRDIVKNCCVCGRKMEGGNNKTCCSKECRHTKTFIPTLIKYFGFDPSYIGTPFVYDEVERIKQMLSDDYWINGLSAGNIAEKYNYPSARNITGKVFRYLNIERKSLHDAITGNYLMGNMNTTTRPVYKSGWHTTFDGKEVYLRSSYEFDYALYLDKECISYDVESLRIKYYKSSENRYACAIPDFYLPDTNTIVEIKSTYTLNVNDMLDKKKAYVDNGYNFKLILDHKETDI